MLLMRQINANSHGIAKHIVDNPIGMCLFLSSKESGGFDLKSFEVRLRPKQKIENLRPGMSVLFPVEQIQ